MTQLFQPSNVINNKERIDYETAAHNYSRMRGGRRPPCLFLRHDVGVVRPHPRLQRVGGCRRAVVGLQSLVRRLGRRRLGHRLHPRDRAAARGRAAAVAPARSGTARTASLRAGVRAGHPSRRGIVNRPVTLPDNRPVLPDINGSNPGPVIRPSVPSRPSVPGQRPSTGQRPVQPR